MQNKKSTVKMLDEMPKFMKALIGDFIPETEIKLDRNEYKTLLHIYKFPNKPMKFYSDYIQIESGSFTYVTEKLVAKNLIIKEKIQKDKRQTTLILTEDGKNLAQKLKRQHEQHLENKLKNLSNKDWEKLNQASKLIEEINHILYK